MKHTKSIKEIPSDERPYEKCLLRGPETLTDSELLAVILRSGTTGVSSIELARKILESGREKGLLGIHHLSIQELMDIRGIGQVKAIQIKCIGELSKRIAAISARRLLDFQNPDTICEQIVAYLYIRYQNHVQVHSP